MLPKKKKSPTTPPPTECGCLMVMGEAQTFLLLPPPTESARLTAIPEKFCYYPPPTESGRPPEITENWPPPKKNPGYAVAAEVTLKNGKRLIICCIYRAPNTDLALLNEHINLICSTNNSKYIYIYVVTLMLIYYNI